MFQTYFKHISKSNNEKNNNKKLFLHQFFLMESSTLNPLFPRYDPDGDFSREQNLVDKFPNQVNFFPR